MNVMQAERSPAEFYDERFVPALFAQWGPVMARAVGVVPGQAVLDVACGTGAATLAAAVIVGPSGRVVGLDANPEMLAVARRKSNDIDWWEGRAEHLPFDDARFDAVVSQFGIMFFDDRPRALREMMRVLKPGGRLAVAVCGALERSPGYASFAGLLDRLFGAEIGNAFRAPFVLGNVEDLERIAREAGLDGACVEYHAGTVSFSSIADMVTTERMCVWTLGGILNDNQFERLLKETETALRDFVGPGGVLEFGMPALILTARKAT